MYTADAFKVPAKKQGPDPLVIRRGIEQCSKELHRLGPEMDRSVKEWQSAPHALKTKKDCGAMIENLTSLEAELEKLLVSLS